MDNIITEQLYSDVCYRGEPFRAKCLFDITGGAENRSN
jgi:hypothetical protein